jgi:2-amino-4-hydroxy-6-hydroxymethyldihydropteridine diphosphokinase
MPRCYISLGGNLGSVGDAFDEALARLGREPGHAVVAVSGYFQTKPVGAAAGRGFLNAAAEIETPLRPLELLDLLQSIETELGRTRTVRWGPRTLDLDLLFYGSEIIDLPRLVVPHPAVWYRRFVLDPLVEIAPRFIHPERQADLHALHQRLLAKPFVAAFAGGSSESRAALMRDLAPAFPQMRFREWERNEMAESGAVAGPALIFWLGAEISDGARAALEFAQLPLVSRIDVTAAPEPSLDFVRDVVQSALG